ncbi:O-antigen polymerase [Aerococcus viridans]|uniref:O-antigen polymerase n=1 Tax=Aerococcus viridans TaxID=1377 RepID=UPI0002FA9B6A|nr:O-antigen polymerase [Aerococcus viridans]
MRKISGKNIMYAFIFTILIILLSLNIFNNVNVINNNSIVIITFIMNGSLIVYELLKPTKLGYSLKEILFIFLFIFMFFSPLVQYLSARFPWWDTHLIDEELIIYCNLIILIFMVAFKFTYNFEKVISTKKNKKINILKNVPLLLDIMFFLTIIISIYIIGTTGLSNLFARSTNSLNLSNQSISLIVQNSFKSVPVFYVALNILYLRKEKRIYRILPFVIGTILMVLINFPTATARFWMASVYIGLFILLVKKFNNPHLFKIIVLGGLFIIFPILNIFRYNSFIDILEVNISISNPADAFLVGDYDSYSMLARALIFSDSNGVTFGMQLLGNLFFFIPRSVWPSKPIGSGAMIGQSFNWPFTNVSMPYIGEGYINFGIFGVILFASILAILVSKSDVLFPNQLMSKSISIIELVYPFSLGFLFFILRGDLLSSLSFYIGFMVPVIIIYLINKLL